MNHDQPSREASDRADVYAPQPRGGAWLAGACGAIVALLGVYSTGRFYGWRMRDHLLIALPIILVAFAVVYVGYRRAEKRRRAAHADELAKGAPGGG